MTILLSLLSWNRKDVIVENLQALVQEAVTLREAGYDAQIAICDNGSNDGTQEDVRCISGVHFIFNETNLGNCVGRNQLIDHAISIKADYLLFVDCDITVIPGSVLEMLKWFYKGNRAASLGANPYRFVSERSKATPRMAPISKVSVSPFLALTQYGLFPMSILSQFRFDEAMGISYGAEDNELAMQIQESTGLLNYTFDHLKYLHRHAHSSATELAKSGMNVDNSIRDRYKYVINKWKHEPKFKQLIDWLKLALTKPNITPRTGA